MQWREVEGLESPPKEPPWLQQPWTGEQKAGTASPPAPAWPGTGLRSLSGPSPQAAARRVPAPEPSSPARRAPAGRAPRGRLSVLLHPRCCAAGVGDRDRAGSAAPRPVAQGAPAGSQPPLEHRAPRSTILLGARRGHHKQDKQPLPRGAGGGTSGSPGVQTSTESARAQAAAGADSPDGRRNPQPAGASGQAGCWQRRVSTREEQPWAGPCSWPHGGQVGQRSLGAQL